MGVSDIGRGEVLSRGDVVMDVNALSLTDVFARITDPRDPRGQRYPLTAVFNLLATAMLAGMKSLAAVAQFGRDHGTALAHALGFRSRATPCTATLSNILRAIDVAAFEAAVSGWVTQRCPDLGAQLAIDGKTLRGSATYDLPGVHLLAAYAPKVAAVVAQIRVDGKTNEHKAALEWLGVLPLTGKVVTGDAMFCHRDMCTAVLDGGGDYVWTVKDNQRTLHADIAALFTANGAFSPLPAGDLGGGAEPPHDRGEGARSAGDPHPHGHDGPHRLSGLAGGGAGVPDRAGAAVRRRP